MESISLDHCRPRLETRAISLRILPPVANGASSHTLAGDTAIGPSGVGFNLILDAIVTGTAAQMLRALGPAVD